ncbi:MAG: gliding motility-associated C-terminal domain-containing protein, partial [Marinoscillum sp.]
TNSAVGTYPITLSGGFDENYEYQRVDGTLTVISGNSAPEIANELTDKSEDEGFTSNSIDLRDVFYDADGDVLNYSAQSSDESIATVTVSGHLLTYAEVSFGTTTIVVTAHDGNGGEVSEEFDLTIVDVNEVPVVANPIGDFDLEEGFISLTIDLFEVFYDADGDELSYEVTSSDESVATAFINNVGQLLTITEIRSGEVDIFVEANDGRGGIADNIFSIRINLKSVPQEAEIPQGFSPNGDGVNDQWIVPNIENYPNNRVNIFDRGGKLIYSTLNYNNADNSFIGMTNASTAFSRTTGLPDGVYYYVIDLGNGELRKGTLIIKQ